MSRIDCETAAQCEQLAATMEAGVADAVVWTVVAVVALVVLYQIYAMPGGLAND